MRLSALGLIVISLFVAAPDADADWVRVRSANFTFIGDAPESQIRAIARQAEQFREVMLRLLPPAQRPSMAPTVVVVFRTHQTFYPYMPKRNGRVFEVGGVFSPGSDGIYMAVNGDSRDFAFETVSHQYAYSLMQNTVGRMPLWLNEGLASVYETYEERDGGKGALIGRAKSQHVDRLRASTFVPLSELMAVDHPSTRTAGVRCLTPSRGYSRIT